MQLNPYLMFNGQCEAAFKFYAQVLGGKIELMATYGNSPMAKGTPPELQDKIMHACLSVGDKKLMGSDSMECPVEPAGYHVSLSVEDPAEAERIFNALAENGKVQMPIQQTFWSVRFGMVVNSFGIPWIVNCEQAA